MNAVCRPIDEEAREARRRGLMVSQLRLYNDGYDARCQGHGRDAGYLLHQATRQPWLMGWHQADYDNGIRIYNGPERPRREV